MPGSEAREIRDDEPVPLRVGGHVYFIKVKGFVKIGFSQDYVARLRHVQTASPFPIKLLHVHPCQGRLEHILHSRFQQFHHRGEWYRLTPEIKEHIAMLKRGLVDG